MDFNLERLETPRESSRFLLTYHPQVKRACRFQSLSVMPLAPAAPDALACG